MLGRTHIDLTQTIATRIGWPGDVKLLSRNASFPDEVRAVLVEGLGAHVFGHNLASLTHFGKFNGPGKFEGYNWKRDGSVPHLDLGSRKVIPAPEAWGEPVHGFEHTEPLAELVATLQDPEHSGCLEADDLTYPAATTMADWMASLFIRWAKGRVQGVVYMELDLLAGWICHLIQDLTVPHHKIGVLLDGHSAFEGDVDEAWNQRKPTLVDSTIVALPSGAVYPSIRQLAEATGAVNRVSGKQLELYRCLWHPGWNKLVNRCVLDGVRATWHALATLKAVLAKGA